MHTSFLLLQLACAPFDTTNPYASDGDGDGHTRLDGDCDDNDATRGLWATDADCDGVVKVQDCDDDDAAFGAIANDADCDRAVAEFDCDDGEVPLGARSLDADCDGALTDQDCDDNDPQSTTLETDADCDAVLTNDDCDDTNPRSTWVVDDHDCDGALAADDCNDEDPTSTWVSSDHDCDGTIAGADCDDHDSRSTTVETDRDCDGALTADDCDDTNPASTTVEADQDCDSVPNADDCAISNPSQAKRVPAISTRAGAYITIPRGGSMSFDTSWSVAMWLYHDEYGGGDVFSDGDSYPYRWCPSIHLEISDLYSTPTLIANDDPYMRHAGGCNSRYEGAGGDYIRPEAWVHTVVIVSGSTVKWYEDGLLTHTSSFSSGGEIDPYTPEHDMTIGSFDGAIADLAFWDRALTGHQAATIYRTGPGTFPTGLVGWWPMDEGIGTTVHEASGMANDGILHGDAPWSERCAPL